jgi:hypothetical protein
MCYYDPNKFFHEHINRVIKNANFYADLQDRTGDEQAGRGLRGIGQQSKVRNSVYLYYYYLFICVIRIH